MHFFERKKTERGEWPTISSRDSFPHEVRVQCWQILNLNHNAAAAIVEELRQAIGVYTLNNKGRFQDFPALHELNHFFHEGMEGVTKQTNLEYAFSVLEAGCKILHVIAPYDFSDKIEKINHRLRLGGVGYIFSNNELTPNDDENLTNTSIIPAVSLLNQRVFKGAYAYIHQAFLDYKEGTPKSLESSIDNLQKAVEALLKIIFDDIGIAYEKADTYMPLILKAKNNGLFPNISDDKLAPLENALKGLGELRNKGGGHGANHAKANGRLVRLALHHATANILFIAETYLEEHAGKSKRRVA